MFNYRLRLRVYNAFFVVSSLLTIAVMAVDNAHLPAYLPLLHVCLAIQVAHTFTIKKEWPHRNRIVVGLAVACLLSFAAQIVVSLPR